MKTLLRTLGLALGLLSPVAAQSGPLCPPKDMLAQLPGTENVSVGQASVSTAGFPGMWQEGRLKASGLQYRLFVNASGMIGEDARMRGWRVDFTCDLAGHACTFTPLGGAPKQAVEAAKAIGNCLIHQFPKPLAHPVSKPARPKALPEAEAAAATRPKKPAPMPQAVAKTTATISPAASKSAPVAMAKAPTPAKAAAVLASPVPVRTAVQTSGKPATLPAARPTAKPAAQQAVQSKAQPNTQATAKPAAQIAAPCWVEGLPEEAPAARTQRLLLLAGFDAGPVDGHFGKRTVKALSQALGSYPASADPLVANGRLSDLLCQKKPGQSRP